MPIRFRVPGPPIAQPRHKIATSMTKTGRAAVHKYLPKPKAGGEHPVLAYKQAVRVAAMVACRGRLTVGPVKLRVEFVMPRPQRCKGHWHAKKPDIDNMLKAVKDALRNIAFVDDAQVAAAEMTKRYCGPGETPCTWIEVEPLEQGDLHAKRLDAPAQSG